MSNAASHGKLFKSSKLINVGLSVVTIRNAIQYTHGVLDQIDSTLLASGNNRLASLVELANLSAIVGNLFRNGISRASNGAFRANDPHTFPDLVAIAPGAQNIETKVALESNHPKGHLIKPGLHLTVRYVLGDKMGRYARGRSLRGDVVWIWEIKLGTLAAQHFSFSNTPGDSGKTAVINSNGMTSLFPVFLDVARCPYSPRGVNLQQLRKLADHPLALAGHSRNLLP